MKFFMKGLVAHLQGNLTYAAVSRHGIDSLTDFFRMLESRGVTCLRIDCGRVRDADIGGVQMLYVWMQCARIRGMESVLVNLPDMLHATLRRLGLDTCFQQVASSVQCTGLTLLPVR